MSAFAKYEIRRPRPFLSVTIILMTVAITVVLLSIYYQQAEKAQIADVMAAQIAALKKQNHQLSTSNKKLMDTNQAKTEKLQFLAVLQVTNEQLQQQLLQLQHDMMALKQELTFYQEVTRGGGGQLQFRKFELHADPKQPKKIAYRLVVTQGKPVNKPIAGTITISLNMKDKQIIAGKHTLQLRYIQIFEGQIDITDKLPASVTVHLKQNSKTALSKTFNWQA